MGVFYLKHGDTLPNLSVTLYDTNHDVKDLSGASSVSLNIKLSDGTRSRRQ